MAEQLFSSPGREPAVLEPLFTAAGELWQRLFATADSISGGRWVERMDAIWSSQRRL